MWVYLYRDHRRRLNKLVLDLKLMLSQVANTVNRQNPSQRIWFIDPNPAFEGHHFCEIDAGVKVIEPDKH